MPQAQILKVGLDPGILKRGNRYVSIPNRQHGLPRHGITESSFKTGAMLPNAQRCSHWAPEICSHPSFARKRYVSCSSIGPGTLGPWPTRLCLLEDLISAKSWRLPQSQQSHEEQKISSGQRDGRSHPLCSASTRCAGQVHCMLCGFNVLTVRQAQAASCETSGHRRRSSEA